MSVSDTERKSKPAKRGDLRLPITPERLVKAVVSGAGAKRRGSRRDEEKSGEAVGPTSH